MNFIDVIIKKLLRVKDITPLGSNFISVAGGVQIANATDTASASNVGTLRYHASATDSYLDVCMKTGAATYAWVNLETKNWV